MKKSHNGALYLLGAAVLWSTAGTLSKYIPWSALSISCIRGVISAAVCFVALGRQKITLTRAKIITAVCYLGESLLFIFCQQTDNSRQRHNAAKYFAHLYYWIFTAILSQKTNCS